MLSLKKFENDLKKLGDDYFVNELQFVPDIASWTKDHKQELEEPHMPMKLVTETDDALTMVVQSDVKEDSLDDVVRNLGVRWSIKDNVTDMEKKLNSPKKRLAYCFLKEYARSLNKFEGDEIQEDEWVLDEMDYLGYFKE